MKSEKKDALRRKFDTLVGKKLLRSKILIVFIGVLALFRKGKYYGWRLLSFTCLFVHIASSDLSSVLS